MENKSKAKKGTAEQVASSPLSKSTEVAVNSSSVSIQGLETIEQVQAFCEYIIKSKMCIQDNKQDAAVAIIQGRELGLAPMFSLNNIFSVNGKATLGVHVVSALLAKAGVIVEVLEDYTPLLFVDAGGKLYSEEEITITKKEFFTVVSPSTPKPEVDKITASGKMWVMRYGVKDGKGNYILSTPDYRTTIRCTRSIKTLKGIKEQIITRSGLMNDYKHLWLPKEQGGQAKSSWANHPKDMLFARVLGRTGRVSAGDVLGGLYLYEELADEPKNINHEVLETNEGGKNQVDSTIEIEHEELTT